MQEIWDISTYVFAIGVFAFAYTNFSPAARREAPTRRTLGLIGFAALVGITSHTIDTFGGGDSKTFGPITGVAILVEIAPILIGAFLGPSRRGDRA